MSLRYALIVTIEGLGTNFVGCYGGALCPTANWDRFASRSIVFDRYWADSANLSEVLRSIATGTHRIDRLLHESTLSSDHTESKHSNAIQAPVLFVTDDPLITTETFGGVDVECIHVEPVADDKTGFEQLVCRALEDWLPRMDEFAILWIHSRGLAGKWDAPYELRLTMCDEGDPEPPDNTDPPFLIVNANTDPDEVFGYVCGAGGQAISMDMAWELIQDAIDELDIASQCMVVLSGVNGFPTGEHGTVGYATAVKDEIESETAHLQASTPSALVAERLHMPLLIRPGNQLEVGCRIKTIVQPNHIAGWVNHWIDDEQPMEQVLETSLEAKSVVPTAFSIAESESFLVVPSWSCRWKERSLAIASSASTDHDRNEFSEERSKDQVKLYALPDDRWQQNEVSSRAGHVVEMMSSIKEAWLQFGSSIAETGVDPRRELDAELVRPIR